MAFAPPVTRDNFLYNGDLYIEVANSNRHKRAPISEITSILRPDLKKANKPPPADQVGHWYEAQLMHYGLPPSKDKARAKMRLLEALNQKKLVVPEQIVKMEGEMKKEYEKAEKKARAEYKASQQAEGGKSERPATKSEPSKVGKKRKQDESSAAADEPSPAKKPKKTAKKTEENGPSKPSRPSHVEDAKHPLTGETMYKRPVQTARNPRFDAMRRIDPSSAPTPVKPGTFQYSLSPSGPFNIREEDLLSQSIQNTAASEEKPAPAKKPTVKKETKVKQENKTDKKSTETKKSPTKKEPSVKKEQGVKTDPSTNSKAKAKVPMKKEAGAEKETKVKKEIQVKKEPQAKRKPVPAPSPKVKPENQVDWAPTRQPPLGLINGLYDISCPTVEIEWNCTDLKLILTINDTSVWGAYDLEMFSGVLFLSQRPWEVTNRPLPFTWRGRENSESQMSFGPSCEGEMTFLGNGKIEGWISVYGRCAFTGVRRPEAGTAVRTWKSMKDEWEGYNQNAYDEENRARWH